MSGVRVRSLTIDLDGTLVDTLDDLAVACNRMLADLGRVPHDEARIRTFVGQGMRVLVERCLDGEGASDQDTLAAGVAAFRRHYAELNGRHARLYPGVAEGLAALRGAGYALGCVTNKPAEFAEPLLRQLGLAGNFAIVISGDTLPFRKPRPEPILHACASLGSKPAANIHVGDSLHDIEAAHAAGCRAFVVPYGYGEFVDSGVAGTLVSNLAEAAREVARINQMEQSDARSS